MKKNNIFISALSVLMALSTAGCKNNNHLEFVTSRFISYDESVLYVNAIEYGATAVYQGETPTRPSLSEDYYEFIGWNLPLENIKVDTTFIAQYPMVNYDNATIALDANGGTLSQSEAVVKKGTAFSNSNIDNPTKDNVAFLGWYAGWGEDDVKITNDYIFNTSITIYAKWDKYFIDITNEDEGVLYDNLMVPAGTIIHK